MKKSKFIIAWMLLLSSLNVIAQNNGNYKVVDTGQSKFFNNAKTATTQNPTG